MSPARVEPRPVPGAQPGEPGTLHTVLRSVVTAPLRFYRRFLSPLKPPMCRFHPTCSQYAIGAIEHHGVLRGTGLAVWRLLRCQPFCRGGHDPVPER